MNIWHGLSAFQGYWRDKVTGVFFFFPIFIRYYDDLYPVNRPSLMKK
jgi:hypothetical protein